MTDLVVLNRQRKHPVDKSAVRRFLSTLSRDLEKSHSSLSIVFLNDADMRTYNRKYRGFDKPTDVLSFPGDDDYLGDILISTETAYNQARKSPTLDLKTNIH